MGLWFSGGRPLSHGGASNLFGRAERDARLASLETKVDELESRLSKNSSDSSKPPSSDPPWNGRPRKRPKSKKKQGGPPGHPRHQRALVQESELTAHAHSPDSTSPYCRTNLL